MMPSSEKYKSQRADQRRLHLFYLAALAFVAVLVLRLIQIQVIQREKYSVQADIQYKHEIRLNPVRGAIYDRRMRQLAMNVPSVSIVAYPRDIKDKAATAQKLSRVTGISSASLAAKMHTRKDFVYLTRRATKRMGLSVEALGLKGIGVLQESTRQYPRGTVASQLLGFTDPDGRGLSGIEAAYNFSLFGIAGRAVMQKTASGNRNLFKRSEYPIVEAKDGNQVVLTIDHAYQSIAHHELRRTIQETNADSGVVIIMDPNTGEVLAMASEPSFNPNNYGKYSSSSYRLRFITDIFEPGSTFKLVTVAGLLNDGIYKPADRFFCENGEFKVAGETIHDVHGYGWLNLHDILVKSSNIGMAKSVQKIEDKSLIYRYARSFGFGAKTGIELPGEVNGQLHDMSKWSGFTPYAMAYGHEVAVSPIQMCNLFCTIANGGVLMRPYIVKEILDPQGRVMERNGSKAIRRVIEERTADVLKLMMADVVKEGTGQRAKIDGIDVCGKTGTARMVRSNGGGYIKGQYIANFGGFLPKDKPRLAIYVMIDNPKGSYLGGDVAAPCFKRIAQQIMFHKGVDIDAEEGTDLELKFTQDDRRVVPNFVGYDRSTAEKIASRLDLDLAINGRQGVIVSQQPVAGSTVNQHAAVQLVCKDDAQAAPRRVVPRVVGLPIRNAINVLSADGINAMVTGSGKVVQQTPPPGRALGPQEQVLLTCETSVDLRKLLIF